jgi:DNA-binding NtrC family response regulator
LTSKTDTAGGFPRSLQPRPSPAAPSNSQTQELPIVRDGKPRATAAGADAVLPRAIRVERESAEPLTLVLYPDRDYVFGRSDECTVVLASDSVSRQHGRLAFSETTQEWLYRDLSSTNGTWLLEGGPRPRAVLAPRRRLVAGADRAMRAGQVLLVGNERNRVVMLEAPPSEVLDNPFAGRSRAARELDRAVELCARHRLPVFLLGRSGSGKTFFARKLHDLSGLKGQFVLINCARLSSDHAQLTSELLGHERGAFTGAVTERKGRLYAGDEGTVFLDEVESMPDAAQGFLLDLLEGSASWAPLGASPQAARVPARIRFVSASKVPLGESGLRADLVQRLLTGEVIEIPSLDERRADIPALVETFLRQLEAEQQLHAELTPDAVAYLARAPWPGEVRELMTTVRVVVGQRHAERQLDGLELEKLVIGVKPVREYLERRARGMGGAPKPRRPDGDEATLGHRKRPQDLLREDLVEALRKHGGNKTHAAQALGIAVNTLKAKLELFGLE